MRDFEGREAEAFLSLLNNQTFNLFISWLNDSLLLEREASDRMKEFSEMKASQGYRCALDDILSKLNEIKSEHNGKKNR